METNNKLTIKRILRDHETLCVFLRRNSPHEEQAISRLSELSGISKEFIKLHIDTIRHWI